MARMFFFFKGLFLPLLWQDRSEVRERKGCVIGKGPWGGIRTRDTHSAAALYVGAAHKAIGADGQDIFLTGKCHEMS